MGLFDRLGNLGKGMVGIMKKGDSAPAERMDALERELARVKQAPLSPRQQDQVDETDRTLRQLKELHAAGILTDAEYAAKLGALGGDALPDPRDHVAPTSRPAPSADPDDPDDDAPIKKTL
jgi:hypothetical protein